MSSKTVLSIGVAVLCAACTADAPSGVDHAALAGPSFGSAPAPDLAGGWTWQRSEHLTFPPFAATVIFGVEPEGRTTVARCESEGTMQLLQDGAAVSGSAATTAGACETLGGQTFPLGGGAEIAGEINGRSVSLAFQGNVLCLLHAVVRDLQAGVASTLQGGGRCVIPGHPQSGAPGFDPPPLGTEVITSWTAMRAGGI
jgi:hypothetical protein